MNAPPIDHGAFERSVRLAGLLQYVETHIADPLPLSRAAQIAALERTYFSRYFRQQTGVCYSDWLRWMRVCRATWLLQTSEQTITEIAYSVGFRDLRAFQRACRSIAGACPRTIRQTSDERTSTSRVVTSAVSTKHNLRRARLKVLV